MKNDTTTTFLNFVLATLVILGVLFALLSIWKGHEARADQIEAQVKMQQSQAAAARATQLLSDVAAYNATAKSPELAQIIREAQTPAPAAK